MISFSWRFKLVLKKSEKKWATKKLLFASLIFLQNNVNTFNIKNYIIINKILTRCVKIRTLGQINLTWEYQVNLFYFKNKILLI